MPRHEQVIIAAVLLIAAIVSTVFVVGRPMNDTAEMLIIGLAATGGLSGALILLRVFAVNRKRCDKKHEPNNEERGA